MTDGKFGFGLIGCGVISDTHLEAIRQIPNADIVAVCDAVEAPARAKAEKYGCDWYTDLHEMLRREEIDIVNITTPSGLHSEQGIACAQAGKHVICTKPIDVTLEKIDALIAACREHGVKLGATHQFRSFNCYLRVRQAIEEGRLGQMLYANAMVPWYRSPEYYDNWHGTWKLDGGGALMNQSIHYVDLLVWFMGDVESLCGYTDTLAHDNMETEDYAAASLQFKSGAYGLIQGTTCTYVGAPARISVHGTKGNVVVEGDQITKWEIEGEPPMVAEDHTLETGASDPRSGLQHAVGAHVIQIGEVIASIEENREPALNGAEARRAVEVILAVYQSSRTRQFVTLPL